MASSWTACAEVTHLEILVEEQSAEAALEVLLPRIAAEAGWGDDVTWSIRSFGGRPDLLKKLPQRLVGYKAQTGGIDIRVLVLVDRDKSDCLALKDQLEKAAATAGLATRSANAGGVFRVCNRIVIEELEAWFIGDARAVTTAYPRVPTSFSARAKFRHPDAVTGGTAESIERLLRKHGYHAAGLSKVRLARDVAVHMDLECNTSPSFQAFRSGLLALVAQPTAA